MEHNKTKVRVGIFVFILFLNFIAAIIYIVLEKGLLEKRYSYTFNTYSAESFFVGMPIKVSGFTIGKLDSIELLDNGTVDFVFSVNEKNQKWISQGSLLMLKKPLLGSSHIILYSAIGNSILQDGSKLEVIISNDIDDLVLKLNPVVTKLENIVNSVDKITTYLAKDDSELMKIVKNIEQFTSLLIENKSLLTTITGNEKATDSLINSMEKLPSLMNNINKISSNVDNQILPEVTKFIKELSVIARDIENKLKKLDGVVNSVGSYDKDLLQIKDGIKTGILKSNEIIEKVDNLFQSKTDEKVILP